MRPLIFLFATANLLFAEQAELSGIHPHLAMFNSLGECGTGAVVPFADRLWVATYSPMNRGDQMTSFTKSHRTSDRSSAPRASVARPRTG